MDNEKAVKNFLQGITEISNAYFVGTTTGNSIGYKVKEEIVFKIRVSSNEGYMNVPWASYILEGDDGQKSEGYIRPSEDGWFYISTSLKCTGFVHLIVKACDNNKNEISEITPFEGGAGADVEALETGTDVPEDYFEFWNRLKEETYKCEPELIYNKKFTPEQIEEFVEPKWREGFEYYDVRIRVKNDMYASCTVSHPINAKPGSLKLGVFYRGYGVAAARGIGSREGYMLVQVNAHSIKNLEPDEYYDNLRENELFEYGRNNEENKQPETTYWAGMFMRNIQAFRFFKNHELLNKKDYVFVGGSQAAMQACNMAVHMGIDCECLLYVPWMADLGGTDKFGRIRGWRPDFEKGLRYFDSAVAAKFLKCPVTIFAGLGDYICPPSGIMAMYNGITSPKKLVMIQNKQHAGMPEAVYSYSLGIETVSPRVFELVGEEYKIVI